MITGTIQFVVNIEVECKDEDALAELGKASKDKLQQAIPDAEVQDGDDDLEDVDDEEG